MMRVALVCVAKNEDNYIHEWINYHKKLGFDDIFIYQNDWDFDISYPNVVTIKTTGKQSQLKSYQNFITTYKDQFDWAAFVDVDEFFVLKKHNNIKEFISEHGSGSSIAVNWMIFGDNNISEIDGNFSTIKRFTKREDSVNPHIKSICNLKQKITFSDPHSIVEGWVDSNGKRGVGPFNYGGPIDVIQINHYFCKTKEEFIQKIQRGRADIEGFRNVNEFDSMNHNEVEDLTALKFYYN
jgi:hypothetical protein